MRPVHPQMGTQVMRRIEDDAAYDAMKARHAKIIRVPCPECLAVRLEQCRTPSGKASWFPHASRRRAAADAGVYVP